MSLRWYSVVIDSHDTAALARWWAETLDWQIVREEGDEVSLLPGWRGAATAAGMPWDRTGPGLTFVPVPETRTTKNRPHIDLAPHTSDDRDALIAALLLRGAGRRGPVGRRHVDGADRPGGQQVMRAVIPGQIARDRSSASSDAAERGDPVVSVPPVVPEGYPELLGRLKEQFATARHRPARHAADRDFYAGAAVEHMAGLVAEVLIDPGDGGARLTERFAGSAHCRP